MPGIAFIDALILDREGFKPGNILIEGDRIVASGSERHVSANIDSKTLIVHCNRRLVLIPYFIDAHCHPSTLGIREFTLNLKGTKSISDIKRKVMKLVREGRRMVVGFGWDHELFVERRVPRKSDLDEVSKTIPILLVRVCGHMAVANSAMIRRLVDSYPSLTTIARIVSDGLLLEEEVEKAYDVIFSFSLSEYSKMLVNALGRFLENNVQAVGFMSAYERDLKALRLILKEREETYPHVKVYVTHRIIRKVKSEFRDLYERGIIVGVKVIADGSFGARTACLTEPYSDAKTRGMMLISREKLREICEEAHSLGLQVAVHAIGDAAIELVLEVYEEVFGREGVRREHHRIEHCSLLNPTIIDIMRDIKPIVVVQPQFILSDIWIKRRLGEKRLRYVYAFKTLTELGCIVAFSSDAPVEEVKPWETIYAATTRGRSKGIELAYYTMHEKLTLEEALIAYTYNSAYAILHDLTVKDGMRIPMIALHASQLEKVKLGLPPKVVYKSTS